MKNFILNLVLASYILVGCGSSTNISDEVTIVDETPAQDDEVTIVKKTSAVELKASNWYVRIVVEDTSNNMKSSDAQLGQLEEVDAALKHSLKAISPFESEYLDVVFKDPENIALGEYKSNFHTTDSSNDSWEFTVKSNDVNADMIISWRGLYILNSYTDSEDRLRYHEYRSMTNPLISHMKLVDVSTGTEVPILSNDIVKTYVFNMGGETEKIFKWVLQDSTVASTVSAKEQQLSNLQLKALREDTLAKSEMIREKRVQSFDMMKPPKFEVLVK